ncbi:MAG: DUF1015 domain-containing protein [Saprospiraceae bacterium]|nr:DUF1015 domain-containing protein [Saprospiraceae bacterium]
MHIQPTQIIYPNWKRIHSTETFFDAVKSDFDAYQQQGNFHWCSKEAIYLMRIETAAQIFNGVACGILVENYRNGNIKGHEATISAKEEKQLELLQERKAQVKPVLLTYPSAQAIENWIANYQAQEAPLYEIQKMVIGILFGKLLKNNLCSTSKNCLRTMFRLYISLTVIIEPR